MADLLGFEANPPGGLRGRHVAPQDEPPSLEGQESQRNAFRRPLGFRLRGGSEVDGFVGCCGCCAVFIFIIASMSLTTLEPNEFGLLQNHISGNISYAVDRGGLHFTTPFRSYIKFPAAQMTLEFSSHSEDRPPVVTRTGGDKSQQGAGGQSESGGQPIHISFALQYNFVPSHLLQVYMNFGSYEATKQRLLMWAGNRVSNTAQDFTPQDFWQRREEVAKEMFLAIKDTLWKQGHVHVTKFEMTKVSFDPKFELSITQVQVSEQKKVINEYEQRVQEVSQSIAVLESENDAQIANISAGAEAAAKEIRAGASQEAFDLKQRMKATKYKALKQTLEFDDRQMSEYFKIKALQAQQDSSSSDGTARLTVGLPPIRPRS
eukprot:TRINITY_DN79985_c0_g1_i1.p1 TRINITY_DN79985_c0_g1~~TRINITY_DN79985_c0_g1_i1.p1  ORF type:complete len:376 (-),score=117.79 TRINITY_DN79985_c0_g1_i1:212-1339(-)